jgi:hypothetical protein
MFIENCGRSSLSVEARALPPPLCAPQSRSVSFIVTAVKMTDPASGSVVGAIGLGVSILALASLFQTGLDVWEYVDLGKRYETKATRLACQLQTEKVRFYLWGAGTHVLFAT